MYAIKLLNGNLLVPRRAEGPGGIVGDGMVEIGPEDEEYVSWLAEAEGRKPHSETMLAYQARAWEEDAEAEGALSDPWEPLLAKVEQALAEAYGRGGASPDYEAGEIAGLTTARDIVLRAVREQRCLAEQMRRDPPGTVYGPA